MAQAEAVVNGLAGWEPGDEALIRCGNYVRRATLLHRSPMYSSSEYIDFVCGDGEINMRWVVRYGQTGFPPEYGLEYQLDFLRP